VKEVMLYIRRRPGRRKQSSIPLIYIEIDSALYSWKIMQTSPFLWYQW